MNVSTDHYQRSYRRLGVEGYFDIDAKLIEIRERTEKILSLISG